MGLLKMKRQTVTQQTTKPARTKRSKKMSRAKRRAMTPISPSAIVPRGDATMLASLLDESSLTQYDTDIVDSPRRMTHSIALATGAVAASLVTLVTTVR